MQERSDDVVKGKMKILLDYIIGTENFVWYGNIKVYDVVLCTHCDTICVLLMICCIKKAFPIILAN